MLYKTIIIQLCTVSVAKKSWLKQCLKMETTCTVMLTNILIIFHGSSGGNSLSAISRSKWNFGGGGGQVKGQGGGQLEISEKTKWAKMVYQPKPLSTFTSPQGIPFQAHRCELLVRVLTPQN